MNEKHYCEMVDSKISELKKNSDVTYLAGIFRGIKATRGKTQWEVIYDKCSNHLVADNTAIAIDNPLRPPNLAYQQSVLKTLNTLGLGAQHTKLDLVVQVDTVRHYLQLLVELKYWADVCKFEVSVSGAIMDVDNAVPCTLHLPKKKLRKFWV
jgi:hypothetical protein